MIAAWILYAILFGTLVGCGTLVIERLLRAHSLPSRWLWVGAMLVSLAWPLGHWGWEAMPRAVPEVVPATFPDIPVLALALEPLAVEVAPQSFLRLLDGPILMAWAAVSGILFLFFAFLFLRTHRLQRQWREGEVRGRSVLYSDEWGPAVVGFARPRIVLPLWCEDLDDRALRLILDHELEHVRAGDLRLIITTGLLPVLLPWHIPIWWQLARLRLAVEGDCDLRVLERNPGPTRPYLELLLDVGRRAPQCRPMATMLSEPHETLKRRIRIMTMPIPKNPWARGVTLTAVGAALVAFACWAPSPVDLDNRPQPATRAPQPELTVAEVVDEPELEVIELAPTAQAMWVAGYQNGIRAEDWGLAARLFRRGLDYQPQAMEQQKLYFWLGYAVLNVAAREQEPNTLETAVATLPKFQEAARLMEQSAAYALDEDMEETRQQLLANIRTYIEIEQAIIRRGPRNRQ